MAGTISAFILVDVLKMVEKYETVDGVRTLTLKPGVYEDIRRSCSKLDRVCSGDGLSRGFDWGVSPLVIGGVLFKPSQEVA